MNRKTVWIAIGVFFVLGLVGVVYAYPSALPKAENSLQKNSILTTPQKVIHHVALNSSGADPTDLLIKKGEYVEFDSKDGKIHDIASGVGDGDAEHHDHTATGVESGDFKADEGYLVQFNKIGSFYFHDHLHPALTISVAVYEPEASSTHH